MAAGRRRHSRHASDEQGPAENYIARRVSGRAGTKGILAAKPSLPLTQWGGMSSANWTFLATLGSSLGGGDDCEPPACEPPALPWGLLSLRLGEPPLRPRFRPPRTPRSFVPPMPLPGSMLFPSYSPYTGLRRRNEGGERASSRPANLEGDRDLVRPRLAAPYRGGDREGGE